MNKRRFGLKLFVCIALVVAGLCCLTLWWKSYRFDDYDMVQNVPGFSEVNLGTGSSWEKFVPDPILYWFRTMGNSDGEVRMFLPDDQRASLEKILKDHDLRREIEHKAPIPSNGILGKFLLSIDGQPYLLVMYYGGPAGEENGVFDFSPVDVTRQGEVLPACDGDQNREGFKSEALYGDLERFLENLPVTSPARRNYDFVRAWWGDISAQAPSGDHESAK